MAPFTAWLPARPDHVSDLVVNIVGDGVAGLRAGITALERALVGDGFEVLAQRGRLDGPRARTTIRLRVSTEPVSSIGSGCDVLAYLDEDVDQRQSFSLGRGSVVLGETRVIPSLLPATNPLGVIAYPIPFTDLSRRVGPSCPGTGLIAVGVLTRLLGIPPEGVRKQLKGGVHCRYFDAGVTYVDEHIVKRDVFALASPAVARRQVMLDAHQAVLLGLGIASCGCDPACVQGQVESLDQWVTTHVTEARQVVSTLKNRRLPGVTLYRGVGGKLMALLGTVGLDVVSGNDARLVPCILMAANLGEAVRLTGLAQRLVLESDEPVWVVVDETLANRQQTVAVETLEQAVREIRQPDCADEEAACWPFRAEREGEPGADVGYVAWGSAQGVVREAVALCRSFGLNVAALYPKVLRPAPREDLGSFAASVKHLVVMEPAQAGPYTALVKSWTGLDPSTITPEPGCALTLMDIFLREGLGA